MSNPNFNVFDAAVAGTLLVSGIFAFRRGLVREVMALGTWVLASLFAFAIYPSARPFFNEHIKNAMLADASTAIALFCLAIVILVPLGDYLSGLVSSPTLSSINRSLGFVFGIIRGFLIACLVYLGLTFIWPEKEPDEWMENEKNKQPVWLEEARTKPALIYGVEIIQALVPEDTEESAKNALKKGREESEEALEDARRLEEISTPVPTYTRNRNDSPSSYKDEAREKMNNLIDRNE